MRHTRNRRASHSISYFVLHRAGFFKPSLLPLMRGALTSPFHPYLIRSEDDLRRFIFCDTIRHILSPKYAPTFIGHSALWCPDFPLANASERPQIKIDNLRKNKIKQLITLRIKNMYAKNICYSKMIMNLQKYSL